MNRRREFLFRDESAERQSRGDRLGNCHDVGRDAKTLEREDRAGTPQSALDLVEDQSRLVSIRQRTALAQKFLGTLVDPAFTENWFEHNRACIVVDRCSQPIKIVLLYECHILEQRLKSFAMLVLTRQRQCSECAPVIRTVQRHQPALCFAPCPMSSEPRQLDRALNRFGTAILKKRTVKS